MIQSSKDAVLGLRRDFEDPATIKKLDDLASCLEKTNRRGIRTAHKMHVQNMTVPMFWNQFLGEKARTGYFQAVNLLPPFKRIYKDYMVRSWGL